MSIVDLLPGPWHAAVDYVIVGGLGAAALGAVLWAAKGLHRVVGASVVGVALVLGLVWTHARHAAVSAEIARVRAEVESVRKDVADRDDAARQLQGRIDTLQAQMARTAAGVAKDGAAASKDATEITTREATQRALEKKIEAGEAALEKTP